MDEQPQQPVQEPAKNPANELQVPAQPNVDSDAPAQPQSQEPPAVQPSPESEPPTAPQPPTSAPEPTQSENTLTSDPNQRPPEDATVVAGGLGETGENVTNHTNATPSEPESIPHETTLPNTTEQPTSVEPTKQEIQERPASPEREPGEFIEKIVEKEVVRELSEDEQKQRFNQRLKMLSTKGNQARSARRVANHQKIVEYLKQHGYITNNEVEKICNVKNPTAWKYLKELEDQNLIVQLGERGKRVRYRLRQAI